jgi:hypothetical protein
MALQVTSMGTFESRVASMVGAISGVMILLFNTHTISTDVINVSRYRLSTAEIEFRLSFCTLALLRLPPLDYLMS